MLITDHVWQQIRSAFTEDQKAQLNAAIVGQTVCPRGIVIEDDKLTPELFAKLRDSKAAIINRGKRTPGVN